MSCHPTMECCPKKVLHHNNARSHTAATTVKTVQLGFELQHPPYSPDLAQSDYHIFGPLKEALRGRRFTSNDEVKEAVHTCLREQPKSFSTGIQKLIERYNKCIVLQGGLCRKIQRDSGGICTTLGNNSISDSKQKSSYENGSDFERLRSYGHFLIPVHALMRTALSLHCKHYFCQLTRPPSYRQSSFRISTLGE